MNTKLMASVLGITDIVPDFTIIYLPMFVIRQLHLPLAKKVKLVCISGHGFL